MNDFINDALLLCSEIYRYRNPLKNWALVNIARNNLSAHRSFTHTIFPKIKRTYAYFVDEVPDLLIEEGVIKKFINNRWIIEIYKVHPAVQFLPDMITKYARENGILKQDEAISFYFDSTRFTSTPNGPVYPGQYAALIDIKALEAFYFKYNPPAIESKNTAEVPNFNIESGEFSFLGKHLVVKGELKKKLADILVKNVNTILDDKTLYNIRGAGAYEKKTAKTTLEKANDANEKLIKELRDDIYSQKEFRKSLYFVNHFGSGLFTDPRFIAKDSSPQQNP